MCDQAEPAPRLDALHERRVRGLPALAQVVRDLLAAREHAVLAQRREPPEQRVRAQLRATRAWPVSKFCREGRPRRRPEQLARAPARASAGARPHETAAQHRQPAWTYRSNATSSRDNDNGNRPSRAPRCQPLQRCAATAGAAAAPGARGRAWERMSCHCFCQRLSRCGTTAIALPAGGASAGGRTPSGGARVADTVGFCGSTAATTCAPCRRLFMPPAHEHHTCRLRLRRAPGALLACTAQRVDQVFVSGDRDISQRSCQNPVLTAHRITPWRTAQCRRGRQGRDACGAHLVPDHLRERAHPGHEARPARVAAAIAAARALPRAPGLAVRAGPGRALPARGIPGAARASGLRARARRALLARSAGAGPAGGTR